MSALSDAVKPVGIRQIGLPVLLHCFAAEQAQLAAVENPIGIATQASLSLTINRVGFEAFADPLCL